MSLDPTRRARTLRRTIGAELQFSLDQGTVTAVDPAGLLLSVDLGGGAIITGVAWNVPLASTPTLPAVGDRINLLHVGGSWLALGKLSHPQSGGSQTSTVVTPSAVYQGSGTATSGSSWRWASQAPSAEFRQGQASGRFYAAAIVSPVAGIPAGATITGGLIRIRRSPSAGLSLVRPTFYRHRLTAPPANGVAPSAALIAGTWQPGTLTLGQQATWRLPSGWLAQLVAGDITGIGVWADKSADYAGLDSPQITITSTGGVQ